jgi:hypothetical protein
MSSLAVLDVSLTTWTPEGLQRWSVWFAQPKYMPNWLYRHFPGVMRPMITQKREGLAGKTCRVYKHPAILWTNPPEPIFALLEYKFDLFLMYCPRIFLWLPHFFVDDLRCPNCRENLEKNGVLAPRRILDIEDTFYIVS